VQNSQNRPGRAGPGQSRRTFLRALSFTTVSGALWAGSSQAALFRRSNWREQLVTYLEQHRRSDGGYAWLDQQEPHLTPTWAVVGCYALLGKDPPRKAAVAQFIRTHHPRQLKALEQEHRQFEFQQIQSLSWLGEDVNSFRQVVSTWVRPTVYLKQYEKHGWPVFASEVNAVICRALLGLSSEIPAEYADYVNSRRRPNGSFNNSPAEEGGDGHVINTWWGLQALDALQTGIPFREQTVEWIQGCQLSSGGFTWQPHPPFAANHDAAYTWAAVKALHLLGSGPANRQACITHLLSLEAAGGGFSPRHNFLSNPVATYYCLDALTTLEALPATGPLVRRQRKPQLPTQKLPRDLKVFTAQVEAHGKGSPAEAVDLAAYLKVHLWGAKNATPEWISRAQFLANQKNVPVTFFVSNEEYGTWVNVPGFGTYSHTSDVMAPAGADAGRSLAGTPVSWEEFRGRRLESLHRAGGRLIWQFGENEELVRLFLDDSLDRGGYAAISTFHFGNPDFTNSEPFLKHYSGRIPFVALQDAHGDEPWWFADMTTGFRTLFLGTSPSWEAWLQALRNNWVMAVRHDRVSRFQTWMHGGNETVREFVMERKPEWQWWNNPLISRPLVSLVAITPDDPFETARPDRGITLRVRCAWENTTQGLPKKPLCELVKLSLNDMEVVPDLVIVKTQRGFALQDYYHCYRAPSLSAGSHTATAVIKVLETGKLVTRTIHFTTRA
jgi:hypothetical protein